MRRGLAMLLLAAGCGLDPHTLLTIEDPSGVALSGVELTIGSPDGIERRSLDGQAFPLTATVISCDPGERTVAVEVFDEDGQLLALGQTSVVFESGNVGANVVVLGKPCASDDVCDDGLFCTGAERCIDGACLAATPPCVADFECVERAECIEADRRCDYGIRHERCEDDGVQQMYCSPAAGCQNGRPCLTDSACNDGLPCTLDRCTDDYSCAEDLPFEPDDDNPCTADTCDDVVGEIFEPVPDGTSCAAAMVDSICFVGVCTPSVCGDGFVDDVVTGETCDDQNDNPNDGCAFCRRTRWDVTLHAAGRTDPLDTAMLAPTDVTFDQVGNLYVTDSFLGHVLVRDAVSGRVYVAVGDGHARQFTAAARHAQLTLPIAVRLDNAGNLYVADVSGVRRLDRALDQVVPLSGGGTIAVTPGASFVASDARFNPAGIALEVDGNLLVAAGNDVMRIDLAATPPSITHLFELQNTANGIALDAQGRIFVSTIDRQIEIHDGTAFAPPIIVGSTVRQLVFDATGRLYVSGDGRIYSVAPGTRTVETWLGDGTDAFAPDGPASTITRPAGLTIDPNGRLVFGENGSGRVRRYANGALETLVGQGGFETDGVVARSLPTLPYDFTVNQMAFEAAGSVVLAAAGSPSQVLRVNDGLLEVIAGSNVPYAPVVDGDARATKLPSPQGVAIDGAGRYYVSGRDAIYRVADGRLETFVSGLDVPSTLAIRGDELLVVERTGTAVDPRGRVLSISTIDGTDRTLVGAGSMPATEGAVAMTASIGPLSGMAVADGVLYISERGEHRVWSVGADGLLRSVAGNGTDGSCPDGAPASGACLSRPGALAADGDEVYVAVVSGGAQRVLVVNRVSQTLRRFAGGGFAVHDGATAPELLMSTVYALSIRGDELYVSYESVDLSNVLALDFIKLVRRIDRNTSVSRTVAGRELPRNEGRLDKAALGTPTALVPTERGFLVADGVSGTIREIDFDAQTLRTVVGSLRGRRIEGGDVTLTALLDNAAGIAFGPAGDLYVSEAGRHTIHRVDTTSSPWTMSTFSGDGVAGYEPGSSVATARYDRPTALAYDADGGWLYVADTNNHVIRRMRIDRPNDPVELYAGQVGLFNDPGDGVDRLSARFQLPEGVAVRAGTVYVADTGHESIREIRDDLVHTRVSAPADILDTPVGIAADEFGNIFYSTRDTVEVYDGAATRTIYGAEPRDTFPESVTRCLAGLSFVQTSTPASRLFAVDRCRGFLIELTRSPG